MNQPTNNQEGKTMKAYQVKDLTTGEIFQIETDSPSRAAQAFLNEGRAVKITPIKDDSTEPTSNIPEEGNNMKKKPAPKGALIKLEKLSVEEVDWIISKLEEKILPHLQADVSNYAKGRMRTWMPYFAPLDSQKNANQPFTPGVLDDEIWQWIVDLCAKHGFKAETCLISKGGAITPHRDTTYAAMWGMGINLGKCNWHIAENREDVFDWNEDGSLKTGPRYDRYGNVVGKWSEPYSMDLNGGEIFTFNTKHIHAVTNVAPDRWAINVWGIADTKAAKDANVRGRLNAMLQKNPYVQEFIDFHQPGAGETNNPEEGKNMTPKSNNKEEAEMSVTETQPLEVPPQAPTRKELIMSPTQITREYLVKLRLDEHNVSSWARIITNDLEYWTTRFKITSVIEVNRGSYHFALAEKLFGKESFCVTIIPFTNPFDPTDAQYVNSIWETKPKDAVFGYADFDAEVLIYVKNRNTKQFSTLAEYGLVVGNSSKMIKRLVELVKSVRGFAIHEGDAKRLRIKVLTHADLLRAFPHLENKNKAGKVMDGISIMATETVKYVFRSNPYMDRKSKAKLLGQIEDKSITNMTLRILTNVNGVAGLIKGNTLFNDRKIINARMRELGLIGNDEVYDVFTSEDNFKTEFGTDGTFEIITLEPHHGPGMVKTNDQMLAQYWGMKGVMYAPELLQAFQVVMDSAYNNIVEGNDIKFLENVRPERETKEADKYVGQSSKKAVSNLAKMAGTLNELELGIGVSQTIMFSRANLIENMFLDTDKAKGENWKSPSRKKRAFMFMPWAYRAYIMPKEVVFMAGYDVDLTNNEGMYHEATQTFMIPGILAEDIMSKLGGGDFDDEVGVHIRKQQMENGTTKLVSFLVRTPNDWAEYWILDVDINNIGPVFLSDEDGIDLPTIYEKDFRKFKITARVGQLPSKVNGSARPTPAVWDWESTRYNCKVATEVGSGVGGQVKTKMLRYGINNKPFATLPCANEDMIDAIQQCKGDINDMRALSDWSRDAIIDILNGKPMDAYWWYSRNMYGTAKGLIKNGYMVKTNNNLRPENSPIVKDLMKPREKMVRETKAKMLEFLNKNVREITELNIVVRGSDNAKYRKLVQDLCQQFKTHMVMDDNGYERKMNKDEVAALYRRASLATEARFTDYRARLIEKYGEEEGLIKFHKHFLKMVRMSWMRKDEAIKLNHADWLNYDRWLYTASEDNNAILMDYFYEAMVWFRDNYGDK